MGDLPHYTKPAYKTLYYATRTGASSRKPGGTVAHPSKRSCSYVQRLIVWRERGGGGVVRPLQKRGLPEVGARHLQSTIATGSFPNGLLRLGRRGDTGSG